MQQHTPVTLLTSARDLLAKGFTRDKFARDIQGEPVKADSPEACRFCAMGAMIHAGNKFGQRMTSQLFQAAESILSDVCYEISGSYSVVFYNDNHSQSEVLALFDAAIKKAQEQEANTKEKV